ncbi:LamG-like jellyroll fold domain-containing protein [Cohnella silvisoli]|uniref:LamG-like jellyroll fold domain-containing protein n=1 Tax=Cohnella silvisoli TaxID=2873699 RepID=A0ABV1L4D1_9BACL|nr:LamG-like jellyroll fold domain-containing protein [Cohnella silvisoli]MCD9026409.1 hypothetical protein [Cohnella silvisoli]
MGFVTRTWIRMIIVSLGMTIAAFGWFVVSSHTAEASNPRNSKIGAIRWDGWTGELNTDPIGPYIGLQVERSLGPNQYHYRLPFYAQEVSYNTVRIDELSQTVMDQQIAYAKDAGIDYWAYVYYNDGGGLDSALQLHLASANQNDVKFSLIVSSFDKDHVVSLLKEPNYMTVLNGRPLVYFFYTESVTASHVQGFRDKVIAAGLPNPYIVAMGWTAAGVNDYANLIGADAVSAYFSTGWNGAAYSVWSEWERGSWDSWKATGKQVVPWVTIGSDVRPRIDNPGQWGGDLDPNGWGHIGTPTEIGNQLQAALNWNNTNAASTEANTALIYSWNEFDEGMGITPTLYNGAKLLNGIASVLGKGPLPEWNPPAALPQPSDSTLAGEWNFNGNTLNSVGIVNAVMRNGGSYGSGVSNQAAVLNGSNHIYLNDSKPLEGMSELTVSAWVKLSELPLQNYALLDKSDANGGSSYRIAIGPDGKGHFVVSTANNYWYTAGTKADFTTALQPGRWYHIAGTYNGSSVKVYVNGRLEGTGTQTISGAISKSMAPLALGNRTATTIDNLRGMVDEFRLYHRALTGTEMSALYSSYGYSVPNLVGQWRFEGNANDSAGNHDGTFVNGASSGTGWWQQGVVLDGVNDYVEITDGGGLDGMSEMTLSAWIRLNQLPAPNTYIVIGKEGSYRIVVNANGTGHVLIATGNNAAYTAGTTASFAQTLTAGKWYHITGTYDGTRVKVYIDGELAGTGSQNISGNVADFANSLTIGHQTYPNIAFFNGTVDELNLYNAALGADSVKALYRSYLKFPSTIGEWRLDGNANDSAGSNNGTAENGASFVVSKKDQGIVTDGSNDYVNIPDGAGLDGMNRMTVSTWVKLNQLPSTNYVIIGKEGAYRVVVNSSGTGHVQIATTNNSWYSTGTTAAFTTSITPGKWYHIVGTYDGNRVRVYVNGELQGTGTQAISGAVVNNASPLRFSDRPDLNTTQYAHGVTDDVKLYNEALTDSQIRTLYDSYNGLFIHPIYYLPFNFESTRIYNGADFVPGGVRGPALSLDGVNDYAEAMGDLFPFDAVNPALSTFTLAVWFKMDQLPANNYIVMGKENRWRIVIDSTGAGHVQIATANNGWYTAGTIANFTTQLSVNEWHQIVGTYDGSRVRVYVDGLYEGMGSQTISGNVLDSATTYGGFGYPASGVNYFDGLIDEAAIYKHALTDSEVYEYYHGYVSQ